MTAAESATSSSSMAATSRASWRISSMTGSVSGMTEAYAGVRRGQKAVRLVREVYENPLKTVEKARKITKVCGPENRSLLDHNFWGNQHLRHQPSQSGFRPTEP